MLTYDNGLLVDSPVGIGRDIFYGTPGAVNTISIVAVDSSGNVSAPATITVDLRNQ